MKGGKIKKKNRLKYREKVDSEGKNLKLIEKNQFILS